MNEPIRPPKSGGGRGLSKLGASFLIALLLSMDMMAQSTDGSLAGGITDPSGAPVPAASIVVKNLGTGVVATSHTNDSGLFLFPALTPGEYSVICEHPGFQKMVFDRVTVQLGARQSLDIVLKIGSTTDTVEVQGTVASEINYQNSSVGNVVTGRKVLELPLVGRNVYDLIGTQAGVGGSNNQNFSGARAGALNITMDGINIQDNYLSALAFTQNASLVNVDRISEFRVVTSPADAEYGRGSGQIQLVSRSGTNAFHGSAFEELRNTVLTANTWFNNQRGNPRNFLNRNQFGARVGGPIKKDRTFFHFHYDGQRQRAHDSVTSVVYTDQARQGIFRFFPGVRNGNALAAVPTVDLAGNPSKPASASGDLQIVSVYGRDPNRLGLDASGNIARTLALFPSPNNFRSGDGLNTAGYTFIRNTAIDYNEWDFKIDHQFSPRHRLSFTYSQQSYTASNTTGVQPLPSIPPGLAPGNTKLATLSLTSVLRSNLINEFRAGVNRPRQIVTAPWSSNPAFLGKAANGHPYLIGFTNITSPFGSANYGSEDQGRISPVYQAGDTMTWLVGKHAFRGGVEWRFTSFSGYDAYAVMPRALLGAGNVSVQNISTISGIGTNAAAAQQMLNELSGSIAASFQTLNSAGGKDPKYIDGQTRYRTWRTPEFSGFFKDDFKLSSTLTLNLGVRYELYRSPEETNGLGLGLAGGGTSIFGLSGNSFADLFHPGRLNGQLMNFEQIGPKTANPGKKLYPTDGNNFAPAIGLSWSLPWFGKGQTVLRAGFGMGYEHTASFVVNSIIFGPGYQSTPIYSQAALYTLGNFTLPLAATSAPLATVPLTDRSQPGYGIDPNLRTPYYENWNLSIQRNLNKGYLMDVRYVGNKGTKLIRSPNVNEGNIFENGILDAFLVTQAGGRAPLFDKIFAGISGVGSTITGSDFVRGFSTTQSFLASNNVGGLANFLNTSALAGPPGQLLRRASLAENTVVANPQVASAYYISNLSNSIYHSLQVEIMKRFSSGYTLQGNYTFSKALGDDEGDEVGFRGTFRTLRDRSLDRRVLSFSRAHAVRINGIYELPFGKSKRFGSSANGIVNRIIGGWQAGGLASISSGAPLTITANNAFNFLQSQGAGASVAANTPVSIGALPANLGSVQRTGNGVVFFDGLKQVVDPWVANIASPTIRAQSTMLAIVDASGRVILANPQPGQLGTLSQNFFTGPQYFRLDLNLIKRIRVTEKTDLILRADAVNATNTPSFSDPSTDINSNTFGRITGTLAGSNRVVVVGLRFNF